MFGLRLKSGSLIRGAATITIFALICKLLGSLLRLYISARIGGEGMGLYSLIISVYTLFTTISTAGLTLTVSRLCAERGQFNPADAVRIYRTSLVISLAAGGLAAAAMLVIAPFAAERAIGDSLAADALRALALSLPFMSATSCMKGLFIARKKVIINGTGSLCEQLVKTGVIMLVVSVFMSGETNSARLCTGITFGITCGEAFSFCYLGAFAFFSKKAKGASEGIAATAKRIVSVNLPIASSVCAASFLHTGESLLIPPMLEKFGGDRSNALSDFGIIRGMVIPLLFFPFAFLGGLTAVMIPEVGRLNARGDSEGLRNKVSQSIALSYLFGLFSLGAFFFLATESGATFYPGSNVAFPLRLLALVTPFMYVETVADSLLKAIGEEKATLLYGLLNSALRIIGILLLIPASGSVGYLAILCVSNTFQYYLTVRRLKKATGYKLDLTNTILRPILGAIAGGVAARLVLDTLLHPSQPTIATAIGLTVMLLVYLPLCIPAARSIGLERS